MLKDTLTDLLWRLQYRISTGKLGYQTSLSSGSPPHTSRKGPIDARKIDQPPLASNKDQLPGEGNVGNRGALLR